MATFRQKLATTLSLAALGAAAFVTLGAPANASEDAVELGDAPFSVSIGSAKAKVGESATINVSVSAGKGYKCNADYPHKIKKLKGTDGVKVGAKTVTGSVAGKKIVYSVPVTPTAEGSHTVTGQIRFSVCTDEQCVIKKVPLNATVTGI